MAFFIDTELLCTTQMVGSEMRAPGERGECWLGCECRVPSRVLSLVINGLYWRIGTKSSAKQWLWRM